MEKGVGNREVHVNFLAFNYLGCIAQRITLKMCVYVYNPSCVPQLEGRHIYIYPPLRWKNRNMQKEDCKSRIENRDVSTI